MKGIRCIVTLLQRKSLTQTEIIHPDVVVLNASKKTNGLQLKGCSI